MRISLGNGYGHFVKELRQKMCLSQLEFGARVGDHEAQVVSMWERGVVNPRHEAVEAIGRMANEMRRKVK